jgi:hypothetical protein
MKIRGAQGRRIPPSGEVCPDFKEGFAAGKPVIAVVKPCGYAWQRTNLTGSDVKARITHYIMRKAAAHVFVKEP